MTLNTTLPTSLARLVDEITTNPPKTAQQAATLVRRSGISVEDLQPWADFDHPPGDGYGRQMVFDGGFFEIMVMSWSPSDYSAIHDHGSTVWGAVQIFGPAEHAVFTNDGDQLVTVSRTQMSADADRGPSVLAVTHELLHQMGNPTSERFLTLHVYGNPDCKQGVTSNARVFNLLDNEIRYTDGGVFYGLDEGDIAFRESSGSADFYTWLFDTVKQFAHADRSGELTLALLSKSTRTDYWEFIKNDLLRRVDTSGHVTDSRYWTYLYSALKDMAAIQREHIDRASDAAEDEWDTYAARYDNVIGTTNSYIPRYLLHVFDQVGLKFEDVSFLDVGCGTGWLEEQLQDHHGLRRDHTLAVDISPAMLSLAATRTNTRLAGLLDLDDSFGEFDITFCNSYQYLDHEDLPTAIKLMHDRTKPGGTCISEFITADHIRWYPNVITSEDDLVITLRNPTLSERGGCTYQESEIINISRLDDLRITYEGVHRRFVCSPRLACSVIEQVFGTKPFMFDSIDLQPITDEQETCRSTRYTLVARRQP